MEWNWWISEFRLFMVQDNLMFAWMCFTMGVAFQYLYERLVD